MEIHSLKDLCDGAEAEQLPIYQIIMENDMRERGVSEIECFEAMRNMYLAMKHADQSYEGSLKSKSQVVGGDGQRLEDYFKEHDSFVGPFVASLMKKAVKMGESNACMKRIVAAPTAGSCGVIPAVILTFEEQKGATEKQLVEALFVSAGVGSILAENASISGAEGGCQAEIGSASAMAAAALAYLEGGSNECIIHAAAIALKGILGLVCDPVAGLVEVPCIKRNVLGAVNAATSAQMALAGIRSVIPPDEVIDAMRRVGNLMPGCLKETSKEGLATTETGQKIMKRL